MGVGYVVDHYVSYFHKEQRKKAYNAYVTDVLKMIAENTAKMSGGNYTKIRYLDIIDPPKEEKRSAGEIINSIRSKLEG